MVFPSEGKKDRVILQVLKLEPEKESTNTKDRKRMRENWRRPAPRLLLCLIMFEENAVIHLIQNRKIQEIGRNKEQSISLTIYLFVQYLSISMYLYLCIYIYLSRIETETERVGVK